MDSTKRSPGLSEKDQREQKCSGEAVGCRYLSVMFAILRFELDSMIRVIYLLAELISMSACD